MNEIIEAIAKVLLSFALTFGITYYAVGFALKAHNEPPILLQCYDGVGMGLDLTCVKK